MSAEPSNFLGWINLAGTPASIPLARAFIRDILGEKHPALDDAELLTSELTTNAVIHSNSRDGGRVAVVITEWSESRAIRISVIDQGSESKPEMRDDPGDVTGRGLRLVELLSTRWGVDGDDMGREIWFEIML